LLDGVAADQINQVWVGGITYIGLQKKFAYLAILMDLCSRKIVG
jgi:transposase InsO family protein